MEGTVSKIRSLVKVGTDNELSFLAGSIAFFASFSILPALLLILALGSVFVGDQFAVGIVSTLEGFLSEEGSRVISDALTDRTGLAGASLLGFGALFWSTLKVFRAIDIAFDRIYGADNAPSLPEQLVTATVVLASMGAGVALIVTLQAALLELNTGFTSLINLAGIPLLVASLVLLLLPVYYMMPPEQITVREAVPGTATAALGLILLQQVFHIYASVAGSYQTYGFLGAVLLFLLWLYFGALALLFGAVVNVVFADGKSGSGA